MSTPDAPQPPEWRACRTCGQRRQVLPDGRFPEHRIWRHACPGSLQLVSEWDRARLALLAQEVQRRWAP